MTTDKIRYVIGEQLYNFWSNCNDAIVLNKAYICLSDELKSGIIPDEFTYKYSCELELLKLKLGI